jgi:heavy metal sensor kinase
VKSVSLRLRLTLWYGGAMIVVLAVYASTVYLFVSRSASRAVDTALQLDFQWPREMLSRAPDGSIAPYYEPEDCEISPWLQVWSLEGELLFRTCKVDLYPVPDARDLALAAEDRIVTVEEMTPPHRVLSGRSTIGGGGEPVVIQVAENEFSMRQDLYELRLILALGLPLGVAVAGLGGYSLARRALAPLDRMAERARVITAERLTERLPVGNPNDELGRLATVFNETLTRLEASFDEMRRFTAHASHELRTPLTAIRSVGEVGLRQQRGERAYREIIGSMLEEVDRLSLLVDRLLMLSRVELGIASLSADEIDLSALASEVVGQLGVLAEEKHQRITVEPAPGLRWTGDRTVLRQALLNLVDNAIKYTPEGGEVEVVVLEGETGALLEVRDTGPGVPEGLEARIFDRFYRVDASSPGRNGGTGLGLSIARWAVEACRGRLVFDRNAGGGSVFRIVLPAQAPEPYSTIQYSA